MASPETGASPIGPNTPAPPPLSTSPAPASPADPAAARAGPISIWLSSPEDAAGIPSVVPSSRFEAAAPTPGQVDMGSWPVRNSSRGAGAPSTGAQPCDSTRPLVPAANDPEGHRSFQEHCVNMTVPFQTFDQNKPGESHSPQLCRIPTTIEVADNKEKGCFSGVGKLPSGYLYLIENNGLSAEMSAV